MTPKIAISAEFMLCSDVQHRLGVRLTELTTLLHANEIEVRKTNSGKRIVRASVLAYIERRRTSR
jgi:hypothetical protein